MRDKQAGFTLIEIMIVIVIIGIFTAALANMATQFYLEKRANTMDARLHEIRSALGQFIADDPSIPTPGPGVIVTPANNDPIRYPCPASLTAVPGDAGFGIEQCPPAGTAVGATVDGVKVVQGAAGAGLVLVGAVPTSTLSISSRNMLDAYNNRFTYAVSWDMADENDNEALNDPTNVAAVVVQDETNTPLQFSPAPFVVVSHGRNGAGSYTAQGVANGNACSTASTDGDARNCAWQTDNSGTFRMQQAFTMGTGAFYDDQIEFTLSSGGDDQWWSVMPGTGQNITNNNFDNVVIGTIAGDPEGKLHVHGDAGDPGRLVVTGPGDGLIQSSIYLSDDQGTMFDNGWAIAQEQVGDDLWIARFPSGGGGAGAARTDIAIDSVTGNVGIGTMDPDSVFHVESNWGSEVTPMVTLESTNDGDVLYVKNTATLGQTDKTIADFANADGSVLFVRGDGNVGIGTAAPVSTLDVVGTVRAVDNPASPTNCTSNNIGATRYNPSFDGMEYCAENITGDPPVSVPRWQPFGGGSGGITIDGRFIPDGTEISCSPYQDSRKNQFRHYGKIINGAIYTRTEIKNTPNNCDTGYVQGNNRECVFNQQGSGDGGQSYNSVSYAPTVVTSHGIRGAAPTPVFRAGHSNSITPSIEVLNGVSAGFPPGLQGRQFFATCEVSF